MGAEIFSNGQWLPLLFAGLMGFAILVYTILDGYDLGVGILMPYGNSQEQDIMIASIGPFWDANETWLVLAVGLLLVAFPVANGVILTSLYLPVAIMLCGLIMRGVAFDFRTKAKTKYKQIWNNTFFAGSAIASFTQGYMLGSYITGFDDSYGSFLFSSFVGLCIIAAYTLIGANWLIMKTSGTLQNKSIQWSKYSLIIFAIAITMISLITPITSTRLFDKWFDFSVSSFLLPIPVIAGLSIVYMYKFLHDRIKHKDSNKLCFMPFVLTVIIFVLCFIGLLYSFFPYIVPNQLTILDAATSHDAMMIMLVGALIVLPILVFYTIFVYRVFHGKAEDLKYD